MLDLSVEMVEALATSRRGDRVVAEVWYGGELVVPDLPIDRWSLDEDGSRDVRQQLSLSVLSEDGALTPWSVGDPLGVGGSEIQLSYIVEGAGPLARGRFRIVNSEPSTRWRLQRLVTSQDAAGAPATSWERWSGQSIIPVQAEDLTKRIQLARFYGPEAVGVPDSVIGEVERLVDGIVPVRVLGVEDGKVPASLTYDRDRLAAVTALLRSLDAVGRMAADGVLEVVPAAPGDPVWTILPGSQGVLVDVQHRMNVEDFPNVAVVEGKSQASDDGKVDRPLVAVRAETTGPLRADGPHGPVPAFLSSDVLDTQNKVEAAAVTRLRNQIAERTATLSVSCLPHPGLQAGDVVSIETPVGALEGPVQTLALSGTGSGVGDMALTVTVGWSELEAIAMRLAREARSRR